jgi:hypothetical protein
MDLKKLKPLLYPLSFWLVFKLVAFLFGFSPWPNIAELALLGDTYPFISAFGFGLWIGAISNNNGFKLSVAIRNAIMVAFIIGFVEMLLTIILINSSPSFVTHVTLMFPTDIGSSNVPLLDLVISTWVGGMFVIIPACAGAYSFMDKKSRR